MNILSRFILSLIFFLFGFLLTLLLPLSFVFSGEKTKNTLNKLNLYEKITPIITEKSMFFLASETGLTEESGDIISPEWVKYLTEKIIDQFYDTYNNRVPFSDLEIDITEIKNNYLNILANHEIDNTEEIAEQVPDNVYLSSILGISEDKLDYFSEIIIFYSRFLQVGKIVLGILFLVILTIYFFVFEKDRFIFVILNNFAILGGLFFSGFFVYRFVILSPRILGQVVEQESSAFIRVFKIIALSFANDLAKVYSFIGIMLIFISVILRIIFYMKKEDK